MDTKAEATRLTSTFVRSLRSGPRTVVKSTSVLDCFKPLGGPCSCLMNQNSCAKNRSTPLYRLSEAIPCEVLAFCICEDRNRSSLHTLRLLEGP